MFEPIGIEDFQKMASFNWISTAKSYGQECNYQSLRLLVEIHKALHAGSRRVLIVPQTYLDTTKILFKVGTSNEKEAIVDALIHTLSFAMRKVIMEYRDKGYNLIVDQHRYNIYSLSLGW